MSTATTLQATLPPEPPVSVRLVFETVATMHGFALKQMLQTRRTADLVRPRQIAMHLAYVHTKLSTPAIGRLIGRDHTTIVHAHQHIAQLRRDDAVFERVVAVIEAEVLTIARVMAGLMAAKPDIDAVAVARRVTDTAHGDTMVSLEETRAMALFILPDTQKEITNATA
jgi:hypothetical protein